MKIIKAPKFKKIMCTECNCVFEYEKGDEVLHSKLFCKSDENGNSYIKCGLGLRCPICGFVNNLEFEALEDCAESDV